MIARPSRRWLWILVGAATLSQATVHLVRPTTTYKLVELQAGELTVGAVTGIYALLPLVLALAVGARAQQAVSLKPFLIIGSLVLSLGVSLVAISGTVPLLALGSALLGLGQLVFTIAGQAAIARFAADDQLDTAFGWFTAGFSAGQMLGPLIGGAMLGVPVATNIVGAHFVVNFTLWIGVFLSLGAIALLQLSGRAFYRRAEESEGAPQDDAAPAAKAAQDSGERMPGGGAQGENHGKPAALKILKVSQIKSHLIASIALLAILDVLAAFLPLLGEESGVSPLWVGILLASRAGASIVSRLLLPVFRRHVSRRTLVITSLVVSGSTLAVSPLILDRLWVAMPLFLVAGFFLGMGQPLTMSAIVEAVPVTWRSSALALRLMGNRVGQVIVPVAAGIVAAPLGPAGAVWTASLALLLSGAEKAVRSGGARN